MFPLKERLLVVVGRTAGAGTWSAWMCHDLMPLCMCATTASRGRRDLRNGAVRRATQPGAIVRAALWSGVLAGAVATSDGPSTTRSLVFPLPRYDAQTIDELEEPINELEEKLVDNRQRSDHAQFRGPWTPPDSFELQVAADASFKQIWRVMVTGARAGYSQVRLTALPASGSGDTNDR